jgi:small-conductance mechanosensitive channel
MPMASWAEDASVPDYAAWQQFAQNIEITLETGDFAAVDLETARSALVDWRQDFLLAQSANAARIETIRAQITSLGPAPTEGEGEPTNVADRRAELATQLASALAPVRGAEESYTRADGLIGEIDGVLQSRQADALMELGPTPLNPVIWPKALKGLSSTALATWTTIVANINSDTVRQTLKANAATGLLLSLLAFFLILRGRHVSDLVSRKVKALVSGPAGQGVSGFVGSLGQVVLPVVGLFALSEAAQISSVLGVRGSAVFTALPVIGMCYFTARWLASRVLFATETSDATFDLTPVQTREASGHLTLMALMFGLNRLLTDLAEIDEYDAGSLNVLQFPLIVLSALSLFRLAQIFSALDRAQKASFGPVEETSTGTGFIALVTRTLTKILQPAAVLAVLLGAVGYMSAANGIVYPAILTLGLLCAVLVTSRFVADLYGAVSKRDDEAGEGLVPVLASLVLFATSLPAFALIWGAREEQLWEIWARMKQGIPLGDAHISITNVLMFLIVFAVGFGLTRLIKATLATSILPKTRIDKGGQNALVSGTGYVGVFLAAISAIMAAGIDLSALALVAGALSVGIGFGLQNIVQNFVSGIILLIERPISEGDWIEVGGQMGFVRNISVRSTRVETFDRTDVIVPNADLISNSVTNYTRGNSLGRVTLKVGVAYGTDTRRVEGILREIIEAQSGIASGFPPQVWFLGFGADSLDFEVRAILRDVTTILQVTSDVNHQIAQRFTEEDIEIPFAQRDIWLRNPEALHGGPRHKPVDDEVKIGSQPVHAEHQEIQDIDLPSEGETS